MDFTDPVELEDVAAVHQAIRLAIPDDLRVESYHQHKSVTFEVRRPGEHRPICKRSKKVIDP